MQKIKKLLRLLGLVFLILLAGLGIGLTGGLPVANLKRREDKIEITDESVEEEAGATLRMEKE